MNIKLEDCILITNEEYSELDSPKFAGQTRVDTEGWYYMVWECQGKYYKTHNKL
jgi:hypothetical protein